MVHDRSKSQVLEDVTNYSVEADCPTAVDGVAYREMNILTFEDVTIEKDDKLPQKLQISKRQPSNMRHYTDTKGFVGKTVRIFPRILEYPL